MRMEERGSSPLVVLGMGGTIDKDYPRLTGGYAFEIDEPAAERILQALPLFGLEWSVKSARHPCQNARHPRTGACR